MSPSKEYCIELGSGFNPLIDTVRSDLLSSTTQADGLMLPFRESSISLVFMKDVLPEINDQQKLAQEIERIIMIGGSLIIMETVFPEDKETINNYLRSDKFSLIEAYTSDKCNKIFEKPLITFSEESFALVFRKTCL